MQFCWFQILIMPKIHIRRPESRKYVDYSEKTFQQCLNDTCTRVKTQRKAASFYGIPRSTVNNKLKGKFSHHPGSQQFFWRRRKTLCESHKKSSESGFPVTEYELRHKIKKNYLTKKGHKVLEFEPGNMPGSNSGLNLAICQVKSG